MKVFQISFYLYFLVVFDLIKFHSLHFIRWSSLFLLFSLSQNSNFSSWFFHLTQKCTFYLLLIGVGARCDFAVLSSCFSATCCARKITKKNGTSRKSKHGLESVTRYREVNVKTRPYSSTVTCGMKLTRWLFYCFMIVGAETHAWRIERLKKRNEKWRKCGLWDWKKRGEERSKNFADIESVKAWKLLRYKGRKSTNRRRYWALYNDDELKFKWSFSAWNLMWHMKELRKKFVNLCAWQEF